MKVSLPVILNEPLTGLQKTCELLVHSENLLQRAAKEPDAVKRLALATIALLTNFNVSKVRTRKPFNPMLGETYELVTEDVKFVAEKVQHNPVQIVAYNMEGKGY